ncbi:MAG: PRC-barrel domain-containing protein [Acidobacteriota bacterium]
MSELIGSELDDVAGSRVGRVSGLFVDAAGGEPVWLVVALGRRGRKQVVVPLRECAAAAGRTWTAQEAERLREAPAVDPTRPLLREHEIAICAHYGIGEGAGRRAELAGRADGAVTAQPA